MSVVNARVRPRLCRALQTGAARSLCAPLTLSGGAGNDALVAGVETTMHAA